MDVFWLIVVLVLLIALFAYVAFLYVREAGAKAPQLWLTGSQKIRQSMGSLGPPAQPHDTTPLPNDVMTDAPRQIGARPIDLGLDDEAVRQLREEFQHDLRQAVGRSREFDARLTRIEAGSGEVAGVPAPVAEELAGVRERQRVEIERLQVSIASVRERAGSYGQRRGQALAELYGCLARVEAALAAVVNPMLLPGEPLVIPDDLPAEALVWKTWGDVGERAYALGNVFNEHRLVLDRATGEAVAAFIVTLRQGLTGSVYPTARTPNPGADQLARMRAGLDAIVTELPVVRGAIEDAYRDDSH